MAQKNETAVLVLALLIVVALVSGVVWWIYNHPLSNGKPISSLSPEARISIGDKILVTAAANPDKQAGVKAIAAKDFSTAINKLQSSLQVNQNDPEALIYLNNAKVSNSNVLKIATSVPIGSNLDVAQELLRGVAQAQDEVNRAGGINGALLQVEIANDENDAEITKQIATELVKDSTVLAVVGSNASNASLAGAPVYQEAGLVMVSPTSVAKNLTDVGNYIFRTVPSIRVITDTLSHYTIKTAHRNSIAICFDSQSPDNQSFRNEFILSLSSEGGKFINISCDFSEPKFNTNAVVSQAISAGADGLLLAPHVDRIDDKALDVARANKGRLALFGNHIMHTFKTLKYGRDDVNGLVLAVPWHPEAFPGNPFAGNARKLWGGEVNWRTAMAYDAAQSIITGLKQGNTRKALQSSLSNPSFSSFGATGAIQFLPSRDRQGGALLVKVQPGNISGTGYDFVLLRP